MLDKLSIDNNEDHKLDSALIDYLHPNDLLIFYGLIKRALAVCQPDIYRLPNLEPQTLSPKSLKIKLLSEFCRSQFLTPNKVNGSLDKSLYLIFDDIFLSGADKERFEKLDEINSKIVSGCYFIDDLPVSTFNLEWEKIIEQDLYYFTFLEARMYSDFIRPDSALFKKIEEGFQYLYNMRIGYFPDFLQKKIEDEYYKLAITEANRVGLRSEMEQLKKEIKLVSKRSKLRKCSGSQDLIKCDHLLDSLVIELENQPEALTNFDSKNIRGKNYFLIGIKYIQRLLTTFIKKNNLEKKTSTR